MICRFASHRKLFGRSYWALQPDYFERMPPGSGVFVCPLVATNEIVRGATRPGDIDLLVIPYESNELVVDRALAMEIKVVRAQFARQGKSPNDFGYSQAMALLGLGFPYVAVVHLIISDESPPTFWRELVLATMLDERSGAVGNLRSVQVDMMPRDLLERSFGRLEKNCPVGALGLVSAYVSGALTGNVPGHVGEGVWFPLGRRARRNHRMSASVVKAVADYYARNSNCFLDNPRHEPQ